MYQVIIENGISSLAQRPLFIDELGRYQAYARDLFIEDFYYTDGYVFRR